MYSLMFKFKMLVSKKQVWDEILDVFYICWVYLILFNFMYNQICNTVQLIGSFRYNNPYRLSGIKSLLPICWK